VRRDLAIVSKDNESPVSDGGAFLLLALVQDAALWLRVEALMLAQRRIYVGSSEYEGAQKVTLAESAPARASIRKLWT